MEKALIAAAILGGAAVLWKVMSKPAGAPSGLGGLLGGSDAASGQFGLAKARSEAGKDTVEGDLRQARTKAGISGALGAGKAILDAWNAA